MQDIKIECLDLSVRAYNCLKRHGVNYKSELENMADEDFYQIRNFSSKNLEEVRQIVKSKSIKLETLIKARDYWIGFKQNSIDYKNRFIDTDNINSDILILIDEQIEICDITIKALNSIIH